MRMYHRLSRRSTIASTVPVMVLAIGVFFAGPAAATASAPDSTNRANSAARIISAVAPNHGHVVKPTASGKAVNAKVRSAGISIPTDPSAGVKLTSDDSPLGGGLAVSLPSELNLASAQVAGDGTVLYPAVDGGASAAVQLLDDGTTRIQTVVPDAQAQHQFSYRFGDGVIPVVNVDGSVALTVNEPDGLTVKIGSVAAPWASDANGNPVSTSFRVIGATLVQTIATNESTAYPVVADPSVSFGWGVYIHYNRTEVHRDVTGLIGAVNSKGKYAAVFCALIPNVAAGAACALFSYDTFQSIYNTFVTADSQGTCAFVHLVGAFPVEWNLESC